MIWAKEETLPRAEIEKIQLERLKESVAYIYERVAPYREKMDAAGEAGRYSDIKGFTEIAIYK